jgi:protein-S-isoprenylcysteine O-methyltransferase Ste14
MLTLYIRTFILVTALVFLFGMQFGFASGPGRRLLRLLLLISIATSIASAITLGWNVREARPSTGVIGTVLSTFGIALFVSALRHHPTQPAKAFSSEAPNVLLSQGPYRMARHPLYLSYLLALFGTSVMTTSWLMVCLSSWMAVVYWYAARTEERLILDSPNGAAYAAYRRKVGMFCPWACWAGLSRSDAIDSPVLE